jgi:hypothetical protein
MIGWLTQLQHTRGKNAWFVMILEEKLDDFNRRLYVPQSPASMDDPAATASTP